MTEIRQSQSRPVVIVLTGGVASGKTTAADFFSELGVPVIDTDLIARDMVQTGSAVHSELVMQFGEGFFLKNGSLDRAKMRKAIFSDEATRNKLEAILHPAIEAEVSRHLEVVSHPYCILVIPLYVESGSYGWTDRVLVIDVPEEIQVKRVMLRDGIDRQLAEAMVKAQADRDTRLKAADDVISNTGDREEMKKQVERLNQMYLELAEQ